jgi:hypothetical protein
MRCAVYYLIGVSFTISSGCRALSHQGISLALCLYCPKPFIDDYHSYSKNSPQLGHLSLLIRPNDELHFLHVTLADIFAWVFGTILHPQLGHRFGSDPTVAITSIVILHFGHLRPKPAPGPFIFFSYSIEVPEILPIPLALATVPGLIFAGLLMRRPATSPMPLASCIPATSVITSVFLLRFSLTQDS